MKATSGIPAAALLIVTEDACRSESPATRSRGGTTDRATRDRRTPKYRTILATTGLLAGMLGCTSPTSTATESASPGFESSTPSSSPHVSVARDQPKLVLVGGSSCGIRELPGLGSFRFHAETKVGNTGDVGIIGVVTATWDRGRTKKTKTVGVGPGQSKRVNFAFLVTSDVQHQTGFDYRCDVKITRARFMPDAA